MSDKSREKKDSSDFSMTREFVLPSPPPSSPTDRKHPVARIGAGGIAGAGDPYPVVVPGRGVGGECQAVRAGTEGSA